MPHIHAGADPEERAATLHRVDVLAARRAELIEVAGSEAGPSIRRSRGERGHRLLSPLRRREPGSCWTRAHGGALIRSSLMSPSSPPRGTSPAAIPVGGVAALAAGKCAVILKPAPAKRCAAELVRAHLITRTPRLIAPWPSALSGRGTQHCGHTPASTGSFYRAVRHRTPVPFVEARHAPAGETSGKNAIIVTPSADPDPAVRDIVIWPSRRRSVSSASSPPHPRRIGRRSDRIARQLRGRGLLPASRACQPP